MQYPVPQFTEVEDKLIGPLSVKQFGIVFGAGLLMFTGYSATKSIFALIILFLIFGLPALMLAFGKINGRPVYKQIPFLIKFLSSPKYLVFHKEAANFSSQTKMKDIQLAKAAEPEKPAGDTQTRIREVQTILKKQQEEEEQLVGRIR